jgi:Ala-tRNA(Pro) deacylase
MAIASSLQEFLSSHGISYEVLEHPRSLSAARVAAVAHVPGDRLAKSVLLEDDSGYVMAVVPATHRVDLGRLHQDTRRFLGLAVEAELAGLFADCAPGAVPPVGAAYGIRTLVDDALLEQPDVYFEAGDHKSLVHVSHAQFNSMMTGAERGRFSRPL